MNENIDLTQILKDCPKGFKLYSLVHGEVSFITSNYVSQHYPIAVRLNGKTEKSFTSEGKLLDNFNGECILFPSKEQRDWSKFVAPWYKKDRFDIMTLKPFDKVLVRNWKTAKWRCDHFSYFTHFEEYGTSRYMAAASYSTTYKFCVPYNDDTKHLVGTTDEAPEYYRYWEA